MTYINTIAYSTGDTVSLNNIVPGSHDEAQQIELLLKDGFKFFSTSKVSASKLASFSMRSAIQKSTIPASMIDMVLFGSESIWDADPLYTTANNTYEHKHQLFRSNIHNAVNDSGLGHARLLGYWLNGCANLGVGLDMAAGMIESGRSKAVMLVYTDKHPPKQSRIMHKGMSMASDVSIALILTRDKAHGHYLKHVVNYTDMSLLKIHEQQSSAQYLAAYAQATKNADDYFARNTGYSAADFSIVVTPNYAKSYMKFQLSYLELAMEQVFMASKECIAHASCCDPFVSLQILEGQPAHQDTAEKLLMLTGPYMWSFIVVDQIT
ncbi:MAG: hypothetical protein GY814_07145 [Gammaproteobacteria bacterium]|nr:hypothetical protein [Gammaproteobacteria bacterium]